MFAPEKKNAVEVEQHTAETAPMNEDVYVVPGMAPEPAAPAAAAQPQPAYDAAQQPQQPAQHPAGAQAPQIPQQQLAYGIGAPCGFGGPMQGGAYPGSPQPYPPQGAYGNPGQQMPPQGPYGPPPQSGMPLQQPLGMQGPVGNGKPFAEGRNRALAATLALSFGMIGVHKAYLGNTKNFLIRLAAGILSSVLSIVVIGIFGLVALQFLAVYEALNMISMSDPEFQRIYVNGKRDWF